MRNDATGRMGIWMKLNSAAMAHMSAMVTSWRVDQRFVFLTDDAEALAAMVKPLFCEAGVSGSLFASHKKKQARTNSFHTGLLFANRTENDGVFCKLCLFHPDCNRWSRIPTGSALRASR